jgi:hypothetical protein
MPSKEAHIAAAKKNEAALRHLLSGDDHLGWVVTVAFYKALHIVEAVFAVDSKLGVDHTDDHAKRNRILRETVRYSHFWKHYRPLWNLSLIARYLQSDDNAPVYEVFSTYMPREAVEGIALGHHLRQIEKSAIAYLGNDFLA